MADYEKIEKNKHTKKISIMAVDDDPVFQKLLSHKLKKLYPSSEVHLFGDSIDALNYYRDHYINIDIVILDMMMPNMNGLELSREIEKINKSERIILISAYSLEVMISKKVAASVEFFLAKSQMDPTLKSFPVMLNYYIQKILSIKENQRKRRKAEESLKKSEKNYRTLVEAIPHGIQEINTKGIITFSNRAHHKIHGYANGELEGKAIWDLLESDKERDYLRVYLQMLVDKQPAPTPYITKDRTRDGRVIDVQVDWAYNRDEKDRIIGFTSVITDITERKKFEDELRKSEAGLTEAQHLARIGSWEWEYVTNKFYCSDEYYLIVGLVPKKDELTFEVFIERVHPDNRDAVKQSLEEAAQKGKSWEMEYRVVWPDDTERILHGRGEVVVDDNGCPVNMIGTAQDITERKEIERDIKLLNETLEQRVAERTETLEKKNVELMNMEDMLREQKKNLEQKNVALSELLGQIELEKKQIKDNVIANAENLLLPIIQKLRLKGESSKYVQLLRKNLQELTSSFGSKLTGKEAKLTSREIEICNMIKNGLTSKEIANLLNISLGTIDRHRNNIRRKLGIVKEDINLSSFLKTY